MFLILNHLRYAGKELIEVYKMLEEDGLTVKTGVLEKVDVVAFVKLTSTKQRFSNTHFFTPGLDLGFFAEAECQIAIDRVCEFVWNNLVEWSLEKKNPTFGMLRVKWRRLG